MRMTVGIILAAGEGSRLNHATKNKTAIELNGKALVKYGIDLFARVCDLVVVVVGKNAESVMRLVEDERILFVHQTKRLGTGHAVLVAIKELERKRIRPDQVLIGYGDHMMCYREEDIKQMLKKHQKSGAVVTLVSTTHKEPDRLAWGRIVRNETGQLIEIVEQKDATDKQRRITEINAGFYGVEYKFLAKAVKQIEKSPVTQEYYLTEIVKIAKDSRQPVEAYHIPFERVGIGINTQDQLVYMGKFMKENGKK